MKKLILLALACQSTVFADIFIQLQTIDIRQSNGSLVPIGSKGILVASTTNDTFGQADSLLGLNLTVGSVFSGDDLVIGIYSAQDFGGSPNVGFGDNSGFSYSGNFTQGDKLALYWFPAITGQGPVTGGTSYGFYRSDTIDTNAGADMAFVAPVDGLAYTLSFFTSSNGGLATNEQLTASNIVPIPEPSTYALMALGLVVVGFIARRKKA